MALNGIITGKLRNLEDQLSHLRALGRLEKERLEGDWLVRMAVERALQICVEIVIDVCHRCLALAGRTPAASSREALQGCVALGVLSAIQPYTQMVGFRNLVVHRYDSLDCALVVEIVNERLGDFERFRDEVLAYASEL